MIFEGFVSGVTPLQSCCSTADNIHDVNSCYFVVRSANDIRFWLFAQFLASYSIGMQR